ncbi:CLUMA_CG011531, isoform A [Clunio marinus]|uniref:CLUMA_CG011531, isoform A n=1 Tax=Clunio marinus TaxID=568069 RepID=A0A1J1ID02_9DIPT|nr:CLUMA_CG011531, isoform A [Clunio marinus]
MEKGRNCCKLNFKIFNKHKAFKRTDKHTIGSSDCQMNSTMTWKEKRGSNIRGFVIENNLKGENIEDENDGNQLPRMGQNIK